MQKSKFTKYIDSLNEEELRHEMDNLFTKVNEVKHYYTLELGTDIDRKRIYDKVKKNLAAKYATKSRRRPRKPRVAKVNAILREVEKHSVYTFELGDVFLYNAECATEYIKKFDFITDPLQNVLISSYTKACLYIRDALMEDEFDERLKAVITNVRYQFFLKKELQSIYDRQFG